MIKIQSFRLFDAMRSAIGSRRNKRGLARIPTSIKTELTVLLVLYLSGCAVNTTVGNDFDINAIQQFQIGKTSMQEAIRVLGEPSGRYTGAKPNEVQLNWTHSNAKTSLFSFNAPITGQTKSVTLTFRDNLLVSTSSGNDSL